MIWCSYFKIKLIVLYYLLPKYLLENFQAKKRYTVSTTTLPSRGIPQVKLKPCFCDNTLCFYLLKQGCDLSQFQVNKRQPYYPVRREGETRKPVVGMLEGRLQTCWTPHATQGNKAVRRGRLKYISSRARSSAGQRRGFSCKTRKAALIYSS